MKLLNSWLTLVLLALPNGLKAAELDLSAPVRVIGSPPAEAPANMPMLRPPPPPPRTLIRGLLPQYKTPRAFRSEVAQTPDAEKSSLRCLLALPDRLLLLEASVTINGQPYEMVRERRIDMLLDELSKPTPATDSAAEETSAEEAPVEPSGGEAKHESEPEVPLVPVPSDALEARLRRYASVTGRPPTRDEVRWLLTKWVDGPTLLLLDDNFQRFRGTQAPAFQILDRDMNGKLSPEEVQDARQTLLSCDVNQNDVVEYTEIAEVADDPRRQPRAAQVHALVPLFDASSAAEAFRRLVKQYGSPEPAANIDANTNGKLDEFEFASLATIEPDVAFTVSFDATDPAKSATRITRFSADVAGELARSLGSSITIPAGRTLVEFSAVQSAALSGSDQISVGIINDGYPLLPALDPNEDGRLTIREVRQAVGLLQGFDANKDGDISLDELPATVRVSFGLGPSVHQHLADIRTVHPPSTRPEVPAPEWFTRMDSNRDGDISPREFLLGAEKFKKLDVDKDGLISPSEAIASTTSESPAAQPEPATKPEEAKATQ